MTSDSPWWNPPYRAKDVMTPKRLILEAIKASDYAAGFDLLFGDPDPLIPYNYTGVLQSADKLKDADVKAAYDGVVKFISATIKEHGGYLTRTFQSDMLVLRLFASYYVLLMCGLPKRIREPFFSEVLYGGCFQKLRDEAMATTADDAAEGHISWLAFVQESKRNRGAA